MCVCVYMELHDTYMESDDTGRGEEVWASKKKSSKYLIPKSRTPTCPLPHTSKLFFGG